MARSTVLCAASSLLKFTTWDLLIILEFGVHSLFVRDLSNVWVWVVVKGRAAGTATTKIRRKLSATCTVPECRKEFLFAAEETRIFELRVPLFERRHFYRSELL
jgi:hypothetical protein